MRRRTVTLAHFAAVLLLTTRPALAGHFVIGVEDMDYAPIMSTGSNGDFRVMRENCSTSSHAGTATASNTGRCPPNG